MEDGFVYVMTAGLRMVKIGSSNKPDSRLSGLKTASPVDVKLFGQVECKDRAHAFFIERKVQNLLKELRQRGEWFNFCPYQAVQIIRMVLNGENLHLIPDHLAVQKLYAFGGLDGEVEADPIRRALVAAGAWNDTPLDTWRKSRDSKAA